MPETLVHEIKEGLKDSEASEETAQWLNGIFNWLFLNLTDSPDFHGGLRQIISEFVVDIRRSPLGYFLIDSAVDSCDLSGSAPILKSIQIVTGRGKTAHLPLSLKIELEYDGICALSVQFKTILGISVRVETFVNKFEGKLCFVIQDRTIHFCFLEPPKQLETSTIISFSFSNSSSFSSSHIKYQVPLINSLISNDNIIKKGISVGPCFPTFLGQWYRAGPDQPPYPWNPSVLQNPHLLFDWSPKLD